MFRAPGRLVFHRKGFVHVQLLNFSSTSVHFLGHPWTFQPVETFIQLKGLSFRPAKEVNRWKLAFQNWCWVSSNLLVVVFFLYLMLFSILRTKDLNLIRFPRHQKDLGCFGASLLRMQPTRVSWWCCCLCFRKCAFDKMGLWSWRWMKRARLVALIFKRTKTSSGMQVLSFHSQPSGA